MNVIVTGASKGLGKAIAEQFAQDNDTLIICARNEGTLSTTKRQLLNKYPGCRVEMLATDLSKKENVIAFGNFCLQH